MKTFQTFEKVPHMRPAKKKAIAHAKQIHEPFSVVTKEGTHHGKTGDYLMMGIHGELYVCDQEIFNNSYDFIDISDAA